jgi:hypothetical protein
VSTPALYAPQDSFHPVRVSARSVRPPLSSWTRTWGTVALVIVLAGGAIGVVTSLRARTLSAARLRNDAARAAQISSERATEAKDAPNRGAPAAAPVFAAPTPVAPAAAANRSAAASAANAEAAPTASLHAAPSVRPSPTAVIYRTPESLAVSPPSAPSAAPAHARRTKPADAPPKPAVTKWRTEESVQEPTPAPATPDVPEKKGESEAWVTEERRF